MLALIGLPPLIAAGTFRRIFKEAWPRLTCVKRNGPPERQSKYPGLEHPRVENSQGSAAGASG